MSEPEKLPTKPDAMPLELLRDDSYVRHAMYDLKGMAEVIEIRFEFDESECECDDDEGTWEVEAWHGNKRFSASHERIENALWFVLAHMTAKDRTDFEEQERKRKEALAKLTEEEKRLLYLTGR